LYRRLLPFMGPAFIASVAYVDPGNFATNIQGGAQFGYMLLWVIVASNLMATHARGAMEGFWAGSLTPKLMQRLDRPILLVRAEGHDEAR